MRAALGYDRAYTKAQMMNDAETGIKFNWYPDSQAEFVSVFTSGTDWDSREIQDRNGIWITVAEVFDTKTGSVKVAYWSHV